MKVSALWIAYQVGRYAMINFLQVRGHIVFVQVLLLKTNFPCDYHQVNQTYEGSTTV
jgi:hypothetical protein